MRQLLYFILLFPILAFAALEIEVTQGIEAKAPIAIVPFQGDDQVARTITDIIDADLIRSGEFELLATRNMAQKPGVPQEVDLDYWRRLKMDAVVVGNVTREGDDKYKVDFYVFDVYKATEDKAPILSRSYTVSERQLRSLSHHISDEVYESLTGHPGAFNTRIAYVNTKWNRKGQLDEYRLEVADSDGYNAQPILVSPEPIMSPTWSPDGREVAYVSFEDHRAQVFIANVASGKRRLVSKEPGINGAPAWSPDGHRLALVLSHETVPKIYVLDLRNNKLEKLTDGWSMDTEPRWSPDGRFLYYTSNRGGMPQIYRVDASNKKVQRITYEGDYNARATPTSDGKQLIMIHRDRDRYHIAVQDLASKQLYILTETAFDQSPSLAPNDRMVIYSTVDGDQRILSAVSLDGRVKLKIPTPDGDVQDPAWSPFMSS